jgi:Spermine/spermidine synthase domain
MTTPGDDVGRSVLWGVGLTTASLMATEIALTRVLSVTVWYHFAFFAISVALLGTGLGALMVHALQPKWAVRSVPTLCATLALLQGLSTLVVGVALVRVTPDWFGGLAGSFTVFTWKLGVVFGSTVLPFVLGGAVLALAASRFSAAVHRIYFADLVGAAVGCMLVLPLLSWLGGARVLAATASLAVLAALAFASDASAASARRGTRVGSALALFVAALCAQSGALQVRTAKGMDLEQLRPSFVGWNAFSMVTVFDAPAGHGWGMSPRYKGGLPDQKSIVIDMSALTPVARFDGDLRKVDHVLHDLSAVVYRIVPAPKHVCVVGAGGGKDVLAALAAGSKRVTGVEINPLIVEDIMRGVLREYSGGLYTRDDVNIVTGDGRAYLRGTDDTFDVILISMVDTSAATAAGAYALTENGLYTREAFDDFLARLRPGGVLTVSTVSLPGLAVGARLVSLARAAVEARGGDPAHSVLVARTPWMAHQDSELYDVIIKPDGFSVPDLDAYRGAVETLAFTPAYIPGRTTPAASDEDRTIAAILGAHDGAALERVFAGQALDVSPVEDDRPFFFYQNRFRDFVAALAPDTTTHLFGNGLRVLAKVLLIAAAMLVLMLVVPLLWARQALRSAQGLGFDLLYVACLGIGFMCVEIALIHRVTLYLGQPTYTLVAVLCVLLLAGGVGSRWLAPKVESAPQRGVLLLAAVVVGAGLWPYALGTVFGATVGLPVMARSVVVALMVAPLGCLLGVALPAGLRAVAARDPSRVAWLWGVNGAGSVLGSIVATLVSLHAGTSMAMLVGCALYACALLVWPRVARASTMPS